MSRAGGGFVIKEIHALGLFLFLTVAIEHIFWA